MWQWTLIDVKARCLENASRFEFEKNLKKLWMEQKKCSLFYWASNLFTKLEANKKWPRIADRTCPKSQTRNAFERQMKRENGCKRMWPKTSVCQVRMQKFNRAFSEVLRFSHFLVAFITFRVSFWPELVQRKQKNAIFSTKLYSSLVLKSSKLTHYGVPVAISAGTF